MTHRRGTRSKTAGEVLGGMLAMGMCLRILEYVTIQCIQSQDFKALEIGNAADFFLFEYSLMLIGMWMSSKAEEDQFL